MRKRQRAVPLYIFEIQRECKRSDTPSSGRSEIDGRRRRVSSSGVATLSTLSSAPVSVLPRVVLAAKSCSPLLSSSPYLFLSFCFSPAFSRQIASRIFVAHANVDRQILFFLGGKDPRLAISRSPNRVLSVGSRDGIDDDFRRDATVGLDVAGRDWDSRTVGKTEREGSSREFIINYDLFRAHRGNYVQIHLVCSVLSRMFRTVSDNVAFRYSKR